MSRYKSGSHRDPYLIQFDRHSELSALHEAKLAAWAFAIGEDGAFSEMPGRRAHRGMLSDLPAPEPPPRRAARRSPLGRLAAAIGRLFQSEWGSAAHIAQLSEPSATAPARAKPRQLTLIRNEAAVAEAVPLVDAGRSKRSHAA